MTPQDNDEQLPTSRIDYALDVIGCHGWRSYHDETKAKLIRETCPGDILDWGEPVVDEKTAAFDTNGHIAGCRGITCKKCWNQEIKK